MTRPREVIRTGINLQAPGEEEKKRQQRPERGAIEPAAAEDRARAAPSGRGWWIRHVVRSHRS
jgi:hypothetical protein